MLLRLVFTVLLAATAQFSLAGKVVVFDHEEALLKTKLAQNKIEALKAKPEYAQMLAQAESLRSDLESLSKEANSKGMTWSNEEKAEQRKKIEYVQADLKLAAQKLQAENSAVIKAIIEEMQSKLQQVLTKYVESEDVDLILRRQVSYVNKPRADITDEITAELDKLN